MGYRLALVQLAWSSEFNISAVSSIHSSWFLMINLYLTLFYVLAPWWDPASKAFFILLIIFKPITEVKKDFNWMKTAR